MAATSRIPIYVYQSLLTEQIYLVRNPVPAGLRHRVRQQAARDAALLTLAYTRGLTAGELCELEVADFERHPGQQSGILVVAGRRLPITGQVFEVLDLWLGLHEGHTWRLFHAFGRKFDLRESISPSGLREIARAWSRSAALAPANAALVNFQNLRASFATLLQGEGASANLINEAMGKRSRRVGPAPDLEVALPPYLSTLDQKVAISTQIPSR